MWRLEPRATPSRAMAIASPLIALAFTALVAGALFAALGKNPFDGLGMFFVEPLRGTRQLTEVALKATPLMLCALGLAVSYRANVWNIGAEGQYLVGATAAGGVALWVTSHEIVAPRGLLTPVILVAGVLGGVVWAGIVALLKDRFHASEILVSLMLVYVAQQLVNTLVFGPWRDPQGFNFPQTMPFDASTGLALLWPQSRLHIGFAIALVLAVVTWLFLARSWRGFQLGVVGSAPKAARYAGFSTRASLWTALSISGGLAGLAGAMEVAGPVRQLTPFMSAGYGFTAIIVCFVGRLHPFGIVLASGLLSMFLIGGELGQSRLGLPSALSGVFQGLLLFLLLATDTLVRYRVRRVSTRMNSLA